MTAHYRYYACNCTLCKTIKNQQIMFFLHSEMYWFIILEIKNSLLETAFGKQHFRNVVSLSLF